MPTTRQYLHLAGTVFRERRTLEQRLLGDRTFSQPERTSAHLIASEAAQEAAPDA